MSSVVSVSKSLLMPTTSSPSDKKSNPKKRDRALFEEGLAVVPAKRSMDSPVFNLVFAEGFKPLKVDMGYLKSSLYLTQVEISQAIQQNKIQEVIQKRYEDICTVYSEYPYIFEQYEISPLETLLAQDEDTGLLPSTLLKTMLKVDEGMRSVKRNVLEKEDVKNDDSPSGGVKFTVDSEMFLAKRDQNNKLHLVRWTGKVFLGDGITSKVWKVLDVVKGRFIAFKEALNKQMLPYFQQESHLLRSLENTTLFNVDGIIGLPLELAVTDLFNVIQEEQYKKYASMEHRVSYCFQIMSQWFVLFDQNIAHGDLKPENIMLICQNSKEAEGKMQAEIWNGTRVKIADLGGAVDFNMVNTKTGKFDLAKWTLLLERLKSHILGTCTPMYICKGDMDYFCRDINDKLMKLPDLTKTTSDEAISEVNQFLKEYRYAMERRDIYALGVSCFAVLASSPPYSFKNFLYRNKVVQLLDGDSSFDPLKLLDQLKISSSLQSLLQWMCHPSFRKRPSKDELQNAWEKLTLKNVFRKS